MNKTQTLLLLAAMAAPAWAQTADYARVRSSVPVYSEVQVPRTECTRQAAAAAQPPAQHEPNMAGIGLGAVAGGLLGHTVGGGNGKAAATAVGAVAGALVGNTIANRNAQAEAAPAEVQNCKTIHETQSRLVGWRVRYEWAGREYEAMLPSDPGKTLPVRVSVTPAEAR